ncbi:MAG: HU family DNA-binding protein [Clostridia bacterium]|nr:HU family DNA-binding protein [Clostridia bacterium]
MNKNEFLRSIADKTDSTIKDVTAYYDAMVETIRDTMKAGDKITLVGFGTFAPKHKEECTRTNPKNHDEKVVVPATTVPTLKFGAAFKDSIN